MFANSGSDQAFEVKYSDMLFKNNQLVQACKKHPSFETLSAVFKDEQASIVVLLNVLVAQYMLSSNNYWYTRILDDIARICYELSDITLDPLVTQQIIRATQRLDQLAETIRLHVATYNENELKSELLLLPQGKLPQVSPESIQASATRFNSILSLAGFNFLASKIFEWFSIWRETISRLPGKIAASAVALPKYFSSYVGTLFGSKANANSSTSANSTTVESPSHPAIADKPDPKAHLAKLMVYMDGLYTDLSNIFKIETKINNAPRV